MLSLPLNIVETVCMSFSLSERNDTSQTEPLTWNPFFFHSHKLWLSRVSDRSHAWTLHPKPASSTTMACLKYLPHKKRDILNKSRKLAKFWYKLERRKTNPIPLAPPVTRAVVPWRLHLLSIFFVYDWRIQEIPHKYNYITYYLVKVNQIIQDAFPN